MKLHGIPHLPGSVELGDFDPTATAVGFELGGEARDFPEAALRATFARYLGEVAERKGGVMRRDAFAPYELRIAGALIRMGDRSGAWDVLALNLAGRRPLAWRQWPEIVWTDETKGQWLGDLPHSWIGSTFLHAVRTALVYERASDQALVLAAGVPDGVARGRRARARGAALDLVGPARLRAAPHRRRRAAHARRRRPARAAGRHRARAAGREPRDRARAAGGRDPARRVEKFFRPAERAYPTSGSPRRATR